MRYEKQEKKGVGFIYLGPCVENLQNSAGNREAESSEWLI